MRKVVVGKIEFHIIYPSFDPPNIRTWAEATLKFHRLYLAI
jgi:hypothetical protein